MSTHRATARPTAPALLPRGAWRRPALRAGALTVLAATVAFSGCSVSRDDQPSGSSSAPSSASAPDPTTEPTAASPTATVTVTETPTASASASTSATPSATAPAPTTAQEALLTATQVPRLNAESAWRESATGDAPQDPFGLCAKFDVLSVGAQSALQRTFTTGAGREASAGQQVVDLADAQTGVRVSRVVKAWHDDCTARVPGTSVKVSPVTAVPVSRGTAWTYQVSYSARGQGNFHSFGMVLSGTRMSLVRIDHIGQDHDYEPGQDPIDLAVKAAAAKIGR